MKLCNFAVPYCDDKRMIYAKEYLEKSSYTCVDNIYDAHFVLLPLPVKEYMLKGLENKTVFLGKGDYDNTYDYYKNDSFVMKNAYLTAEGAVCLAVENTDISLYSSKILICGFGRIGKALLHILSGYGADITVCSRSSISECESAFLGAHHINFNDLKKDNDFDIVFNTVPHMIFTQRELKSLKRDVCLIDLASFPGGVDTLVSSSLGINLVDAKALPSRFSVKSAGYLIGETVDKMIEEGII